MTRPGYDDMRLDAILPKDFAAKFTYDKKMTDLQDQRDIQFISVIQVFWIFHHLI